MSSLVRRASHTQYVPQVGRPQTAPQNSATKHISAPVGAMAAAKIEHILLLVASAKAENTAIST